MSVLRICIFYEYLNLWHLRLFKFMTISVTILQYTTDEQLSRVMFLIQSHLTITYEFNFLKYFNRTF